MELTSVDPYWYPGKGPECAPGSLCRQQYDGQLQQLAGGAIVKGIAGEAGKWAANKVLNRGKKL